MIYKFKNIIELSEAAASQIEDISKIYTKNGLFSIALCGGSTPVELYKLLGKKDIDWEMTHLFMGDERLVPIHDKNSNYRMIKSTLLQNSRIPERNIHTVFTDLNSANLDSIDDIAEKYENELRTFFSINSKNKFPEFSLVLLGAGKDGHTASLFPDTSELKEKNKWVVPVRNAGLEPHVPRISVSLPLINNARNVFFLLKSTGKEHIIEQIENPEIRNTNLPVFMINPKTELKWFYTGNS